MKHKIIFVALMLCVLGCTSENKKFSRVEPVEMWVVGYALFSDGKDYTYNGEYIFDYYEDALKEFLEKQKNTNYFRLQIYKKTGRKLTHPVVFDDAVRN